MKTSEARIVHKTLITLADEYDEDKNKKRTDWLRGMYEGKANAYRMAAKWVQGIIDAEEASE